MNNQIDPQPPRDGEKHDSEDLLPLVYDELRQLAARQLAQEKPGQTLDATSLVHEAYLRLVSGEKRLHWTDRGHFFRAAAESMRRILINRARDKQCVKRGRGWERVDLDNMAVLADASSDDLLAIDEALARLREQEPRCAELVTLRFFAGLTLDEAAKAMEMGRRSADRYWAFARAWLYDALSADD